MAGNDKPWILRGATLWAHFRSVPIKRLWILIAAVFLLFSVTGFYVDLLYKGVLPYAAVLTFAVYSGLNASLWLIVLSRLSRPFLIGLIALQFFSYRINNALFNWMVRSFDLQPVPSEMGIRFAANATMSLIFLSDIFFYHIYAARGQGIAAHAHRTGAGAWDSKDPGASSGAANITF